MLRSTQQVWIGRRVRHRYEGRIGRVVAVSTYGPWTLGLTPYDSFDEAHPFLALVRWDDGAPKSIVNLTFLELVDVVKAPS